MEVSGKTDVGLRRKLNEDQFLFDADTNLLAVCDGMGGHNAGEVASRIAIETLASFIERSHKEKEITWPYGLDPALSFDGNRVRTAIQIANKKVYKAADNREEYTGMGTTVVAAIVTESTVTVGSAGDSRCYVFHDGELRQITRDDSWVAAAGADGILSPAELARHPLRNVITKAIGAKDQIEIDIVEQDLEPGDTVLLCSDGLHAMIDDTAITEIMAQGGTVDEIAARLVEAANSAGGKDNVTVVLARVAAV
jgi:serine/threonine protein phosphatase PrpC